MTAKKIMGIIILIAIGGIGLFIFILYATIKTKSTNISKYEPFNEWVGKTATLNRETILFIDKLPMYKNSTYPYVMLDSLHPMWQYAEDRKNLAEPELVEITSFPAGTTLKIEKAIQYTNGVSGSSYPMVFGTVSQSGRDYKIGYRWGSQNMNKAFANIEECWQFHQAPWQTHADTAFYALPEAHWW